ncbi:MAG: cupin domain-containing protein [Mariniphaga sp.]|jgi:predicted cupin superfamily sugar epimerase|nr:cupin domain-containing protein [Mariniphaga sp.]
MKTVAYWIEKLELEKHPEGGWFREIYLSDDIVPQTGLPSNFRGERSFATSIYYLLEGTDFSAFHRIKSDEIWHYYTGTSAIEILSLQKGKMEKYLVGADPESGQTFQVIVPKNTWFASRLVNPEGYALAGCTVSPGFHFEDFELANSRLVEEYPEFRDEILPFIK